MFSLAMFEKYSDDPMGFFQRNPDPQTAQKALCAAYNRGPWWNALPNIFTNCTMRPVTDCFEGNAIAIDHANAIAAYTRGLDAATPFDAPVSSADLDAYWTRIRVLYPEADDAAIRATLQAAFDRERAGAPAMSFRAGIRGVLADLVAALPAAPTLDDATRAVCRLGYMQPPHCP